MNATLLLSLAIVLASITAASATTASCAVVLNTPDGFLALREGPGTQFRIKDKLSPSQTVDIKTAVGTPTTTSHAANGSNSSARANGSAANTFSRSAPPTEEAAHETFEIAA